MKKFQTVLLPASKLRLEGVVARTLGESGAASQRGHAVFLKNHRRMVRIGGEKVSERMWLKDWRHLLTRDQPRDVAERLQRTMGLVGTPWSFEEPQTHHGGSKNHDSQPPPSQP